MHKLTAQDEPIKFHFHFYWRTKSIVFCIDSVEAVPPRPSPIAPLPRRANKRQSEISPHELAACTLRVSLFTKQSRSATTTKWLGERHRANSVQPLECLALAQRFSMRTLCASMQKEKVNCVWFVAYAPNAPLIRCQLENAGSRWLFSHAICHHSIINIYKIDAVVRTRLVLHRTKTKEETKQHNVINWQLSIVDFHLRQSPWKRAWNWCGVESSDSGTALVVFQIYCVFFCTFCCISKDNMIIEALLVGLHLYHPQSNHPSICIVKRLKPCDRRRIIFGLNCAGFSNDESHKILNYWIPLLKGRMRQWICIDESDRNRSRFEEFQMRMGRISHKREWSCASVSQSRGEGKKKTLEKFEIIPRSHAMHSTCNTLGCMSVHASKKCAAHFVFFLLFISDVFETRLPLFRARMKYSYVTCNFIQNFNWQSQFQRTANLVRLCNFCWARVR